MALQIDLVDQTCLEPGRGDSLSACLASILRVPLGEVPDSDRGLDLDPLATWLAGRGLALSWLSGDLRDLAVPSTAQRLCVVIGPSPRNPGDRHAVVGEVGAGGIKVVWDPHPSRAGVLEPWTDLVLLSDWFALRERLYPTPAEPSARSS